MQGAAHGLQRTGALGEFSRSFFSSSLLCRQKGKRKKNFPNLSLTSSFSLPPFLSPFRKPLSQEKSSEYYILREVYRPLEFLFSVAAVTTLAENFLPQLIALPKAMVQTVVRSTLSLTFVLAAARVVFNIKGRVTREAAWKLELSGDLTKQRRVEAVDKLLSVLFLLVTSVLGLQAAFVWWSPLQAVFGTAGLSAAEVGSAALVAAVIFPAMAIEKALTRRAKRRASPSPTFQRPETLD